MQERYAIYYAPAADSDLWALASAWLGRDARTGAPHAQPVPGALSGADMLEMTRSPRRYGFHATLKPPMRLVSGIDPASVADALDAFARATPPAETGHMDVRAFGTFLALVPKVQSERATHLAAECVHEFDLFRAPLQEADLSRWEGWNLTGRQASLLERYGYPFVRDEYRLHLTLSDSLDPRNLEVLAAAANDWFAKALAEPLTIDRLSLYREAEPGAPFERIADFPLTGRAHEETGA